MFQKLKAKNAEHEYEAKLAAWQTQHDNLENCIKLAQTFKGVNTTDIMLKPGEALFYYVTGASLVGERRGAGHYEGRSSGVSVPIGHIGHSTVRYHVGSSKGHYVQGTPYAAAVDVGTVFITNKRVIFEGNRQTRECNFDKLVGFHHDQQQGSTTFSVSNRQKPTTVHYGVTVLPAFAFRLELALANYKGTVPQLIAQFQQTLTELDTSKPTPPAIAA